MFIKYIWIPERTVQVTEGPITVVTDQVIEVYNEDYNELRQRFPGEWTLESHWSNPVGPGGPTWTPIQGTYEQLLALELANMVVSSQVYEMTDYQTYGLTKMEQELVSWVVEPMYLTGVDGWVFSVLAQSSTHTKDVIYYDITKREILTVWAMDIEGNAWLPPLVDNSVGVTFDNLVGDTFTLTYPYALDFSKEIDIDLYNDFSGEQWFRNDTIQNLITAWDIVVNDLWGNQYEIQILFISDAPFGNLFDFANLIWSNWFFKITTQLPAGSNKGTIMRRYNPDSNIEAKIGADVLGSIDTADFRAAIQRRYDMTWEWFVAPKNTNYDTSISWSWGTTTETYAVNPAVYDMLPTVAEWAKNITLVGWLSTKNITILDEVDWLVSPDSDKDAHYQGQCTGITIEEGCINSVIILNGQRGTTVTNGSSVFDIVYKVEFVNFQIIWSNIQNWITPDTQVHEGWLFEDITMTGWLTTKSYGSFALLEWGLKFIWGIYNSVQVNFSIVTWDNVFKTLSSIYSDVDFSWQFGTLNKFRFLWWASSVVLWTTSDSLQANDVTFWAWFTNCVFAWWFGSNTWHIINCTNNNFPLANVNTNHFNYAQFFDNSSTVWIPVQANNFSGAINGNVYEATCNGNVLPQWMSDCIVNQPMTRVTYAMRVANQIWDASWTDCLVETELLTAKTYTVAQTNEKITDREWAVLYKRSIVAGVYALNPVT